MDNEQTFQTAMDGFISRLQNQINNHYKNLYPNLTPSTFSVEYGGKFARVIMTTDGGKGQRMVHCFVAMQDGQSKATGCYKQGDILKAASWKQPAKHSRGSIYADNWAGYGVTPYGTVPRRRR